MEKCEKLEKVVEGTYGKVYKARDRATRLFGPVEDHVGNLALALFDSTPAEADGCFAGLPWEAFPDDDQTVCETAPMQPASTLPHQKPSLGGGLDLLSLDGMYPLQPQAAQPTAFNKGSASSIVLTAGRGRQGMLALPAPSMIGANGEDLFSASAMVALPVYVQMSDIKNKQRLLVEEQVMWQQNPKEGMQGAASLEKVQANPYAYYHHQQQQRQSRRSASRWTRRASPHRSSRDLPPPAPLQEYLRRQVVVRGAFGQEREARDIPGVRVP